MKNVIQALRSNGRLCLLGILISPTLAAQGDAVSRAIIERLDRLEQQNQMLQREVQALRGEVAALRAFPGASSAPAEAAAGPTIEERLAVAETRVEEQAQTKVEASQRFPIRLTGMALVNAFVGSAHNGGRDKPLTASIEAGSRAGGATMRQSVIGLDFRGPTVPGDGHISGSLMADFYLGPGDAISQYFRLRTGSIRIDWPSTSILVGQEKPIISPREPDSLSQVGVSPLTSAGNLWLWQLQARIEQRFSFGERTMLRAQAGVYQMDDDASYERSEYADLATGVRPALQGRFELGHGSPQGARIEVAPGFHVATSHVGPESVPSRIFSVDWLVRPVEKVELTGMFFRGKNVSGLGALRQGFRIYPSGRAIPVHSNGGWSQLAVRATPRLSFHFLGGQQDDRDSDLPDGGFGKNQSYGANVMFRIAPNVILSFENMRTWTTYVGQSTQRNSHYDLAVAYTF